MTHREQHAPVHPLAAASLICLLLAGCLRFSYDELGRERDAGTTDEADGGGGAAGTGGRDSQIGPCAGTLQARAIDVVDSQVVEGPHHDFPLLISLTTDWLRSIDLGGQVVDAQAADLRFAQDSLGTSLLDTELEQYDATTGRLIAWVRVPSLEAKSMLYVLYGACAAALPQSAGSVWSDYRAVWHMQDNHDASGQNADAIEQGGVASGAGQIGGARRFGPTYSATFSAGQSAAINDLFRKTAVLSAWIHPSASSSGVPGQVASKTVPFSLDGNGWALLLDPAPEGSLLFRHGFDAGNATFTTAPGSVALGSWHLIAMQYENTSPTQIAQFFIDGQPVHTTIRMQASGNAISDAANDLHLGNAGDGTQPFDGWLDEVRLTQTPRSAGWLATEYNNQSNPAGFYAVTPP